MWKYLSTGAPAFRNFRLVAPDWRGWKQRFTSGKGQNRSRWICIYVWCIAERGGKGEERASWARSERFSLAFHGMRSCFKILVNLASLSPCTHTYIYIYIFYIRIQTSLYFVPLVFSPMPISKKSTFSLPFFSFSFLPWPLSLLLITQFIFILRKIYADWRFSLSSHFRFPHFFLSFSFFCFSSPLSLLCGLPRVADGFSHRWRKNVFTDPRAFIWHSFESLFSGASPRFTLHLSRCNDPLLLSPQQDRWIPLPLILPGNERTRGNFTPRIYLLVYDNMLKSSAWV